MSHFEEYANRYSCIQMRRENGILEMRFHTDGGSLRWGLVPHGELPEAFADVGRDRENRVVILTGTGDEYSGVRATPGASAISRGITAEQFDRVHWEGRALLMNLLAIEVPVIAAINGPAWRHGEIPLLSDIVLASETAAFQDSAHFVSGLVPGDGMHIVRTPHQGHRDRRRHRRCRCRDRIAAQSWFPLRHSHGRDAYGGCAVMPCGEGQWYRNKRPSRGGIHLGHAVRSE